MAGHSEPLVQELVQALPMQPGQSVLEVGCGNGSLIRLLDHAGEAARPCAFHAVDAARLNTRWLETLGDDLRTRVQVFVDEYEVRVSRSR